MHGAELSVCLVWCRKSSEEEREHAEKLMVQQNRRGGRVKLHSILLPETEFNHKDKGDALYAMELALSLEKLNFTKLRELHRVACNAEDAQLADFIGARPQNLRPLVLRSSLCFREIDSCLGNARYEEEIAHMKDSESARDDRHQRMNLSMHVQRLSMCACD